jgi:hypothetical protein
MKRICLNKISRRILFIRWISLILILLVGTLAVYTYEQIHLNPQVLRQLN